LYAHFFVHVCIFTYIDFVVLFLLSIFIVHLSIYSFVY
jgi:hypothetical protein